MTRLAGSFRYIALFLSCFFITMQGPAVTVRVQGTRGGPQIHVDGKPVPPRFFWGGMNSGHMSSQSEWASHSFEFLPGAVSGTGTLHFRFSQVAGDVWLADVRVQDAVTGEDILPPGSFATAGDFKKTWNIWPPGEANTVGKMEAADGVVHVNLKNPPAGKWPDFHLHSNIALSFAAGRTYRCTFRAKSAPVRNLCVALYSVTGGQWNFVGGAPGNIGGEYSGLGNGPVQRNRGS